jgi:hypothetical protein
VRSLLIMFLSSDEPVTTAKDRLNHTAIASLPPSVFANVSMQNGSSRRLDCVGRNHVMFRALYLEFKLSLQRPRRLPISVRVGTVR